MHVQTEIMTTKVNEYITGNLAPRQRGADMAARPLACARLPIHGQHGMDLCPPRPTLRINTMRLALKDKWMTSQLKFHVCLVSQGNKLTSGLTTAHGCNWISLKLRCKKHKSGKVIFLFACCKGKGFFMAEIIFPKIISFCQTFKALSCLDFRQLEITQVFRK